MAFIALLAVSTATVAGGIQFRAEFDLRWFMVVVAKTSWEVKEAPDGTTEFISRTVPSGMGGLFDSGQIVERSTWTTEGDLLRPIFYSYLRKGRKVRDISVLFDFEKEIAYHDDGGRRWRLEIPQGTLDKLSYLIAVMADLSRGKTELNYPVADGKRLSYYEFENLGEERIDTDLGTFDTVVFRHKGRNDRETTLWCAPQLRYFPIRATHHKSGLKFEAVIRSLDMNPPQ